MSIGVSGNAAREIPARPALGHFQVQNVAGLPFGRQATTSQTVSQEDADAETERDGAAQHARGHGTRCTLTRTTARAAHEHELVEGAEHAEFHARTDEPIDAA